MAAYRSPSRRQISQAEADLWARVTKTITRLPEQPHKPQAASPASTRAPHQSAATTAPLFSVSSLSAPPLSAPPLAISSLAEPTILSRRERNRIANGYTHVVARLDLHGMTVFNARRALQVFIINQAALNAGTILVITGKGKASPLNQHRPSPPTLGRLRSLLPQWLHEDPLRSLIISFAPAKSRHGGDGAWYIRIRHTLNHNAPSIPI